MKANSLFSLGLLALAGCAAMNSASMTPPKVVNGGFEVEPGTTLNAPVSSYTAPKCKLADGSSIDGPTDVVFDFVPSQSGLTVFERHDDGGGTVITNRWTEAARLTSSLGKTRRAGSTSSRRPGRAPPSVGFI